MEKGRLGAFWGLSEKKGEGKGSAMSAWFFSQIHDQRLEV